MTEPPAASSPPRRVRLHAIARGRVQGVGFRAFTERHARSLGLLGWVRNRADGGVEIVAEGDGLALERLLAFVHCGPSGARVDGVDSEITDARGDLRAFDVEDSA